MTLPGLILSLTNKLTVTNRLNVPIPMTSRSYYTPAQASENLAAVHSLRPQFGLYVTQAAKLTNVPEAVIESVMFIESAGKPSARSSAGAVGLMQLTPATVPTILFLEKRDKRLSVDEALILRRYLGTTYDRILKLRYLGDTKAGDTTVTASQYSDPEINILLGAMMLGRLMDEEGNRLDIVVSRYNAGYFWKPKASSVEKMISLAQTRGGAETANYILKLVGKNGLLDTLT